MDRTTVIKLRNFLVKLYGDLQTIRRVIDDADLDASHIILGGNATNIWHGVLDEAQKQDKVDQLIAVVLLDYPKKRAELNDLLGKPSSVERAPDSLLPPAAQPPIATSSPQPTTPASKLAPAPLVRTIPITLPRALRLTTIETHLLSTLFGQATKLTVLTEFTDGRTPTRVLLVRPTAADGVDELPAVVKVGPHALIDAEWQATQRQVLDRLPGFAAVRGEPLYLVDEDGARRGALRYTQVGEGVFTVESLARYSTHATVQDLWQVLNNRLFRQLGTLWRTTQSWATVRFQQRYDAILPVNLEIETGDAVKGFPLLLAATDLTTSTDALPQLAVGAIVRLEGFVATECSADGQVITLDLPQQTGAVSAAYRLRLQRPGNEPPYTVGATFPTTVGRVHTTRQTLLQGYIQPQLGNGVDLTQPTLTLPDQTSLPNPLPTLPMLLTRTHEARLATIHGDLNLRNILIDPDVRTAHIIDCASARQDHVLHDLLRLERDILTDLAAQTFFQANLPATAIVRFYRQIHCATQGVPHDPGHFARPTDLDPALAKLFVMIVTVRQAAHDLLATPGQWAEYYTGLIIHLLGALKFRDLDNPPPGQRPKAIAFWAAATLVGLLDALEKGDSKICRDIELRFFDITRDAGLWEGTKGVTLSPTTAATTRGGDPTATLESLPTKGLNLPAAADLAPVQRRLDVAAPERAALRRAFALAVAVRKNDSPRLAISELPMTHSGEAQLDWPDTEPFLRVRVQVVAPECKIEGEASYTFKLYRNLDSVIYRFSLIPQTTGQLTIIVRLYLEDDFLGSAQAQTTVSEQLVGEVPFQLQSSAPVTVQREAESSSGRTRQSGSDSPSIKILFLAANPLDMVRLRTGEEARAIDQALRQAEYRVFDIQPQQAVRIGDLQDLLMRHNPDILHFSGHGSAANELMLQDAQGKATPVRSTALSRLFQVHKGNIRCIVLNACYTEEQAKAIAQGIDCVVGIDADISDEAALQFATAFYRALGYGRSIQQAFEQGQLHIELAGLGGAEAFHLHGTTAAQIRFAGQPTAPAPTPTSTTTVPPVAAPSSPGKPAPMTKRQLSVPAKMQLAEALLACPTIANRHTRDVVVNDLPDSIKGNIRRSDTDRVDVVNIITTALNYVNGLEDLVTIVRFYEGDSIWMQGVDQLLAK